MTANKSDAKLRLGGPCFEKNRDPESLVKAHLRNGFGAAYDPGVQDPVLLDEILKAYAENDIIVAETGAYGINLLETDEAVLEENVQKICRLLERAEKVGSRCCVGHGGRVPNPNLRVRSHNPENFSQASIDKMVGLIQRIVDTVKPVRTRYTLETESRYLPDSPEIYLEIIKAVDRPGFAAHLDPINITSNPRRYYFNGDFIRNCFSKLGPYIRSCHSKDTMMVRHSQVRFDETYSGNGELDHGTFMTEIVKLDADVPMMIEHVNAEQLALARDFLHSKAEELGIGVTNSEFREQSSE